MRHLLLTTLAALGLLLSLAAGQAAATVSNPSRDNTYNPGLPGMTPAGTPQLSPYLQLLRGGDPAANYYGGVVPERNQRAIDAQFGSALQQLQQQQATAAGTEATSG